MQLPERFREGWIKFAVGETDRPTFAEATKGRLYFKVPQLLPGAIDEFVWRLDPNGVVFRFDGPAVAAPPLSTIPRERQVHLSGSWIWTWAAPARTAR
jgi:catechol 2,3-dioxygenase-like lactoylglutathione lyase family enzyme